MVMIQRSLEVEEEEKEPSCNRLPGHSSCRNAAKRYACPGRADACCVARPKRVYSSAKHRDKPIDIVLGPAIGSGEPLTAEKRKKIYFQIHPAEDARGINPELQAWG